jgi:hypothetical protein
MGNSQLATYDQQEVTRAKNRLLLISGKHTQPPRTVARIKYRVTKPAHLCLESPSLESELTKSKDS